MPNRPRLWRRLFHLDLSYHRRGLLHFFDKYYSVVGARELIKIAQALTRWGQEAIRVGIATLECIGY